MADMNQLPPSKLNAMYLAIPNPGKCLITTIVSGVYEHYAPLFCYCAKKAYPEYDVDVATLDENGSLRHNKTGIYYTGRLLPDKRCGGREAACLRFLACPDHWRDYDYVYITDVDILIRRETPSLVDQHMMDLRRSGLECYSNYVSSHYEGEPRLPGVHFVTRDWWGRTADARARYLDDLRDHGSHHWAWDEVMLARIVTESGLPVQTDRQNMWAMHGVHLGDYRRRIGNHENKHPTLNADNDLLIRALDADQEFMEIFGTVADRLPHLRETWTEFKRRWGG